MPNDADRFTRNSWWALVGFIALLGILALIGWI